MTEMFSGASSFNQDISGLVVRAFQYQPPVNFALNSALVFTTTRDGGTVRKTLITSLLLLQGPLSIVPGVWIVLHSILATTLN